MAHIELSGVRIEYDLLGPEGAHCVAITPGGRMSMEAGGVRQLGEALAALGKRVLLWDRPNCGLSDLHFEGDNESAMHGRFLTQLIRALGLGPTALAGGSAGSRVSLLAAVQDPGIVSHLVQWWISGGTISLMMLGASYDCEPAVAASMGGMEGGRKADHVHRTAHPQSPGAGAIAGAGPGQIRRDDGTLGRGFRCCRRIRRCRACRAADWAGLKMPVLIFRGSEKDIYHHRRITEWAHRLIPHAETGRACRGATKCSPGRITEAGKWRQPAARLADAGPADRGVYRPSRPVAWPTSVTGPIRPERRSGASAR